MRTAVATLLVLVIGSSADSPTASAQTLRPTIDDDKGADVLGAFADSFKLLMIEHGWRIAFQEKTRRELGGPFWMDYKRSVRIPAQWGDSDAEWVNYIGHPIHGAASGFIWLDHERHAPLNISLDNRYWSSRARAMAWSAVYSLQFEIGPLSEASIGNVGMRRETTGWVDHVITPLGTFAIVVAEDAMDRYVVRWVEARVHNPLLRIPIRMAANPARTMSNASLGRAPWSRVDRRLSWK